MKLVSGQILTKLYRPPANSHKGDNGRLLIIAGSKKYHGSLVLCATMASKIADLVYIHTTPANVKLLQKIRGRLSEFIYISKRELKATLKEVDAVLIGPGLIPNIQTKKLISWLLKNYPQKKIVLDAGALRVLDLKQLNTNCVLTPHLGEFRSLFGNPIPALPPAPLSKGGRRGFAVQGIQGGLPSFLRTLSLQHPAVIILKGHITYICQNGQIFYNTNGNAGMTKGGTGDVLAGLLAALLTKNNPLTATAAAVYVNGKAGDKLKKKFGFYYSASELIDKNRKILK